MPEAIVAFADLTTARRAIRRYLASDAPSIAPDTLAQVEDLADSPSPVDQIVRVCELLYARRDELDHSGRELVAGLASFAAIDQWHGMADGNRGRLIAAVMNDDSADAPEPKPEYVRTGRR